MKSVIISLLLSLTSLISFASADDIAGIARLREAADSLHSIGRTDSAAVVGEEAIRRAVKSGDPVHIVGTNAAQGVFLRSLGRIDEALQKYETALAIITSGKFRLSVTKSKNRLRNLKPATKKHRRRLMSLKSNIVPGSKKPARNSTVNQSRSLPARISKWLAPSACRSRNLPTA